MLHEEKFLTSYEAWFQSPEGVFALECALRLTRERLSPWSRRGRSLLLLGFSHWKMVEMLWESGFDVTVYAASDMHAHMVTQALPEKVDVYQGTLEHLPFDDAYFDYVALMPPPRIEAYPPLHSMLHEAHRLAHRGLFMQCLNPNSLVGIGRACPQLPPFLRKGYWCSWRDVHTVLRAMTSQGQIRTASILHGPLASWKSQKLARINARPLPHAFGALMHVRLTLDAAAPLTGLPLLHTPIPLHPLPQSPLLERQQNLIHERRPQKDTEAKQKQKLYN